MLISVFPAGNNRNLEGKSLTFSSYILFVFKFDCVGS